jgi:hypothetical protein
MTQSQRDRLAFVELRLRFIGEIRRQDLVARFGIQAAATRDIGQYKELGPRNLDYDTKSKVYVRGEWFRPVFDFPAERMLTWLSQGFGDGEPSRLRALVTCEGSALSTSLDLEMLSVLTRIADARLLAGPVKEIEAADQDIQWNRIAEIELVPHPANVQHPDTIEAEYGMENGVLRMRVRAAMAGYLMRRRNVDCTEDHSLKGAEFHLWLRNRQALYGVTNLVLAPGYEPEEKA